MKTFLEGADKWIYLYRKDIVEQAISWLLALQTGSFSHRSKASVKPVYDFPKLNKLVSHITVSNNNWKHYFKENGITPLEVVTEDFLKDRPSTINRICDHLEVTPPKTFGVGLGRVKQDYPEKSEWYERYFNSLRGCDSREASGFNYKAVDRYYEPLII